MAVRPIVISGDPVLHSRAREVDDFGEELRALVADMYETMDAAPGVGLAAPQVGVPLRIFTFSYTDDAEENRLALFLRNDGTTGQAFESGKRGFHVGVQPDGMAGLCVVDDRGRELDRLGSLPEELQTVRLNHVIYGTVPGPFRTGGAPVAENSAPLQALLRQAETVPSLART